MALAKKDSSKKPLLIMSFTSLAPCCLLAEPLSKDIWSSFVMHVIMMDFLKAEHANLLLMLSGYIKFKISINKSI
jgi:hypothetical protein